MKKLFLLFLFISSYQSALSQESSTKALLQYARQGYLAQELNQIIWNVSNEILANTDYHENISINDSIFNPNHLNFFVIKNDPRFLFSDIDCNCAYLGFDNTIVCDYKVFDSYFSSENNSSKIPWSDNEEETEELITEVEKFLTGGTSKLKVEVLLAHEIGHFLNGHGTGNFYFEGKKEVDLSANIRSLEEEADLFAANYLISKPESEQFWIWIELSSLINFYFGTLGQWFEGPNDQIIRIPVSDQQRHPPLILRLLNMVDILIAKGMIVDNSDYFKDIRSKLLEVETTDDKRFLDCKYYETKVKVDLGEINERLTFEENFNTGKELFQKGQYKQAEKFLAKGISQLEADVDIKSEYLKELLEAYRYVGIIKTINGELNEGKRCLLKVNEVDEQIENQLWIAINYFLSNDFKASLDHLDNLISKYPFNADAFALLAMTYFEINEKSLASSNFQRALILSSKFSEINWLIYSRRWPKQLIVLLLKMRAIDSNFQVRNTSIYETDLIKYGYKISGYLYQIENLREARLLLKDLINGSLLGSLDLNKPEEALLLSEIYNFLGMVYHKEGNADLAINSYLEALELRKKLRDINSKKYTFFFGQTLNNLGNLIANTLDDKDKAIPYYKESIGAYESLYFKDLDAHYLGEIAKTYFYFGNIYWKSKLDSALYFHSKSFEILKLASDKDAYYERILFSHYISDLNLLDLYNNEEFQKAIELLTDFEQYVQLRNFDEIVEIKEILDFWKKNIFDSDFRNLNFSTSYFELFQENKDSLKLIALRKSYSYYKGIKNDVVSSEKGNLGILLFDALAYYSEDLDSAIWYYQKEFELLKKIDMENQKDSSYHFQFAKALGRSSWINMLKGNFELAKVEAEQGLLLSPDAKWIYSNLAIALLYTNSFKRAKKIYKTYKEEHFEYIDEYLKSTEKEYSDTRMLEFSQLELFKSIFLRQLEYIERIHYKHPKSYNIRSVLVR